MQGIDARVANPRTKGAVRTNVIVPGLSCLMQCYHINCSLDCIEKLSIWLSCAAEGAFVVTFGRAGEDNKKFKLGDADVTLQGFAGADYDLQVGCCTCACHLRQPKHLCKVQNQLRQPSQEPLCMQACCIMCCKCCCTFGHCMHLRYSASTSLSLAGCFDSRNQEELIHTPSGRQDLVQL